MSVTVITGDILNTKAGIVCQQVNCRGKMGAGIALKIRKKWPVVYDDYMYAYNHHKLIPGEVILSQLIPSQLYIANLCGQINYGRGKQYTIYKAVRECLIKINMIADNLKLFVYIPKNMGCGLAGGDWNIVFKMIEETIPNATIINYN